MAEQHPSHAAHDGRFDGRFGDRFDDEIRTRGVLVTTAILGGLCLLAMVLMWGMKRWVVDDIRAKNPPISPLADPTLDQRAVAERMPRGVPVLQPSPEAELIQMRREQAKELHGWGWVDEAGGIVRVPIEVAMEQVLAKGLPSRSPATSSAPPAGEERTPE